MPGAPDVQTNAFQQSSTSSPVQDAQAAILRSKQAIQNIPVYVQTYQYSVPSRQWDMGWKAPDVPTIPGPTYVPFLSAPDVPYKNKSYPGLVQQAASPVERTNRGILELTAPYIQTTYS